MDYKNILEGTRPFFQGLPLPAQSQPASQVPPHPSSPPLTQPHLQNQTHNNHNRYSPSAFSKNVSAVNNIQPPLANNTINNNNNNNKEAPPHPYLQYIGGQGSRSSSSPLTNNSGGSSSSSLLHLPMHHALGGAAGRLPLALPQVNFISFISIFHQSQVVSN